ncbi:uncharacterized protein LOC106706102 [Latimeria chalumnae]|uniref:uncharacterized protein LOC106706102 n=1 Tax=Latimeria chalumnae TaxID=7897 RepID=UPI0006D91EC6|nr:PREDICTED: uncharacterized protein LOC106706102 [Latimeria chalumnae]|eukprot:XP_014352016.1 PREDICTED: uncharacterized protein LOC106706102 [Latimeria chalumnae]
MEQTQQQQQAVRQLSVTPVTGSEAQQPRDTSQSLGPHLLLPAVLYRDRLKYRDLEGNYWLVMSPIGKALRPNFEEIRLRRQRRVRTRSSNPDEAEERLFPQVVYADVRQQPGVELDEDEEIIIVDLPREREPFPE